MRLLSLMLVVAALAAAACGSSSSTSTSGASATTATSGAVSSTARFALHAGLAFGAFHHFIYQPLKSGALRNPLQHKLATLKAVLAGAFTLHEVKAATEAAKSNPKLAKLAAPLTALGAGITAVIASAKSGKPNLSQLESSNSAINSIKSEASSAGTTVAEKTPSL
jgi:hypothetical protein